MTIAIHQPNFLPWIGYYQKIINCDYFVLLDDVCFSKNSFINRNRIKTLQGENWITIPVVNNHLLTSKIYEVKIDYSQKWQKKLVSTFQTNYARSQFYKTIIDNITSIIFSNQNKLIDLNYEMLLMTLQLMSINIEIIKSSDLNITCENATERLVNICKKLNATTYLSGCGAIDYQDVDSFRENNIDLVYNKPNIEKYNQLWGDFIPNLSIIDLLFNYGKDSIKYLK
jgi:hypothetical protein